MFIRSILVSMALLVCVSVGLVSQTDRAFAQFTCTGHPTNGATIPADGQSPGVFLTTSLCQGNSTVLAGTGTAFPNVVGLYGPNNILVFLPDADAPAITNNVKAFITGAGNFPPTPLEPVNVSCVGGSVVMTGSVAEISLASPSDTCKLIVSGSIAGTTISYEADLTLVDPLTGDDYYELTNGIAKGGVTFGGTAVIPAPEINLTNGSVFAPQSIADDPAHVPTLGDSTDFGTVALTGGTKQNTFQIENTGTGDLTLDGASPFVVIGGTHAADFTVISNPTTPITAGDRSLFTIRFDPTAAGLREATVSIANNDADEDPYNFNIQGTGADTPTFTKAFAPDTITAGDTSTLTFTIDNTGNPGAVAGTLDFTDNLPAGVFVAAAPVPATSCKAGTLTATAGTGTITYTGNGSVGAGLTCTVTVPVTSAVVGAHLNTSGDLTSDLGNSGTASATLTVGAAGATAEETQKVIAEFMSNRAAHILNNQPSLIDLFTGNNANGGGQLGNLALNGNADGMNLAFATSRSKILAAQSRLGSGISQGTGSGFGPLVSSTTSGGAAVTGSSMMSFAPASQPGDAEAQLTGLDNNPAIDPQTGELVTEAVTDQTNEQAALSTYSDDRTGSWDIWTEVYGSMASAGASESTLWVGYLGTHIFVSPDMLIGIMGQLDWADETNSTVNSNADGMGWMIGPYVAGRIPGQNLYYEARAAWGRSDNDVSPIGTYTDGFETERWMALAKLEGAYEMGNLTIRPSARVAWYEETQESYTDTNAVFIPSQTISLGEFRFGPDFVWDILLDDGTLFQPSVGVAGVFNFGIQNNVASQGFALGDDDLRARFEAGFNATNPMGMILTASGFYDGIGINNYYSYGGSVRLTVPLN